MDTCRLGKTDVVLTRIGIGTWEIAGDVWGKKDDATSISAILKGLEAGARFIDTAAGYGRGHAERLVARALKEWGTTSAVCLSTKVLPKNGKFAPGPHIPIGEAYPKDWIVAQVDESLKRLERETIDVIFLHTWSRAWGHEHEWHEVLQALKSAGKVRAVGISIPDEGITDANVAVALEHVDAIQCVYNVFQQEPRYSLFPLARQHKVGIIARSPFSSGALTGTWKHGMQFEEGDWRASWPLSVKPGWLEEQLSMSEVVKGTLKEYTGTWTEAAIQFILESSDVTSVIPGSGNPMHVTSNVRSVSSAKLPAKLSQKLQALWAEGKIHGTYNGSI